MEIKEDDALNPLDDDNSSIYTYSGNIKYINMCFQKQAITVSLYLFTLIAFLAILLGLGISIIILGLSKTFNVVVIIGLIAFVIYSFCLCVHGFKVKGLHTFINKCFYKSRGYQNKVDRINRTRRYARHSIYNISNDIEADRLSRLSKSFFVYGYNQELKNAGLRRIDSEAMSTASIIIHISSAAATFIDMAIVIVAAHHNNDAKTWATILATMCFITFGFMLVDAIALYFGGVKYYNRVARDYAKYYLENSGYLED